MFFLRQGCCSAGRLLLGRVGGGLVGGAVGLDVCDSPYPEYSSNAWHAQHPSRTYSFPVYHQSEYATSAGSKSAAYNSQSS